MNIGVFDSGLGGLTVVNALQSVIKGANIYYVGDTYHAPYGAKTPKQILDYSLTITHYLITTYNIDALVLACNTATSFAIEPLRILYPHLIIIGTEPGVKPAINKTKTGKIGVLATPATLQGEKYQNLVTSLSQDKEVEFFEQACPGLVEQIEQGFIDTQETKRLLEAWVLPMKQKNIDTIVLGCTHYPLIGSLLYDIMGKDIHLIDTGSAIAKRLLSLLFEKGHLNEGDLNFTIETTDFIEQSLAENILHLPIRLKIINILSN